MVPLSGCDAVQQKFLAVRWLHSCGYRKSMGRSGCFFTSAQQLHRITDVPSIFISIYIAPASSLDAIFFLFTQTLERRHPRLPSHWVMFLAVGTCPSSTIILPVITHFPFFFCSNLDIFPSNALIHQLQPYLACTIIIVKASLESDSFSPSFSHQSRLKSEPLARPIRLRALVLNMSSTWMCSLPVVWSTPPEF